MAKNDAKVAKLQETTKNEILSSDEFLDRGFTRPKVLNKFFSLGGVVNLFKVNMI